MGLWDEETTPAGPGGRDLAFLFIFEEEAEGPILDLVNLMRSPLPSLSGLFAQCLGREWEEGDLCLKSKGLPPKTAPFLFTPIFGSSLGLWLFRQEDESKGGLGLLGTTAPLSEFFYPYQSKSFCYQELEGIIESVRACVYTRVCVCVYVWYV